METSRQEAKASEKGEAPEQPAASPAPPRHLPFVLAYPGDAQGCGWHRIRCPAAGLLKAGIAYVRAADGLIPISALLVARPDVIVWQHQAEEVQLAYMREARAALPDCQFVFEIDDHLAAVDPSNWHEAFIGPPEEMERRTAEAASLCDRVVTTTEGIAEWVRGLPGVAVPVTVLPNYLLEIGCVPYPGMKKRPAKRRVRVCWSGGMSHGGDLEVIGDLPSLVRAELKKRGWRGPDPEFIFHGMKPGGIAADSFEFRAGVPPTAYADALAGLDADLMLAPLRACTFNECKSALRLEQAGWAGAAVLASPVGEYVRVGSPAVWRFVGAGGPDEGDAWAAAVADWVMTPEPQRFAARTKARMWASKWGLMDHVQAVAEAWGLEMPAAADAKISKSWVVCGLADTAALEADREKFVVVETPAAAYETAREIGAGLVLARAGSVLTHAAWTRLKVGLTRGPNGKALASASAWSNDGALGAGFFETGKFLPSVEEISVGIAESLAEAAKKANPVAVPLPFPVGPVVVMPAPAVRAVAAWPRGSLTEALGTWGLVATAADVGAHELVPGAWVMAARPETEWKPEAVGARGLPFGLLQAAVESEPAKEWRRVAELWHLGRTHEIPVINGSLVDALPAWMAYHNGSPVDRATASLARIPVGAGAQESLEEAQALGLRWVRWDFPNCAVEDSSLAMLEEAGDKADVDLVYGDWIAAVPMPGPDPKVPPKLGLTPVLLGAKPDWVYGLARDWVSATAIFRIDAWVALGQRAPESRADVWEAAMVAGMADFLGGVAVWKSVHVARSLAVCPEDFEQTQRRREVIAVRWPEWQVEDIQGAGLFKVRRKIPAESQGSVSVIIPTTGDPWILRPCLASMERHTDWAGPVERIIVLTGTQEEIVAAQKRVAAIKEAGALPEYPGHRSAWPAVRVIGAVTDKFSFSVACNVGAAAADGKTLVFCNDDIRFPQDSWLGDIAGLATVASAGWVQPRILNHGGVVQCAGCYAGGGVAVEMFRDCQGPELGVGGLAHTTHAVGATTAALTAIGADKFFVIRGFPDLLPLNFNDIAAGVAARRAGFTNLLAGTSDVIHGHSMTRGRQLKPEEHAARLRADLAVLKKHWPDPDPAFPENLQVLVLGGGTAVGGMKVDQLKWHGPGLDAPAVLLIGRDVRGVAAQVRAGRRAFVTAIHHGHLHTVNPHAANQPAIDMGDEKAFLEFCARLGVTGVVGAPVEGEETILPDVLARWNEQLAGAASPA